MGKEPACMGGGGVMLINTTAKIILTNSYAKDE